jgi:dipeptidyl aminopeptidase/acylaminoacyl peptidase
MIKLKRIVAVLTLLLLLLLSSNAQPVQRTFKPEDLFRIRQVGVTRWSPDGLLATVELSRPGRGLESVVPSNELALLDVKTGTLRTLTSNDPAYLGFFNAVWSPDGRRLAFLSVDLKAVVQPWIWTVGESAPKPLMDFDVRLGPGETPLLWADDDRLAVVAWDEGSQKGGTLSFRVMRGGNSAAQWKRAYDGKEPAVSVMESGKTQADAPSGKLVIVNLRNNERTVLVRGNIHRVTLSADGKSIGYLSEHPAKASSYFAMGSDIEQAYAAVNWGTERRVIDARSGADAPLSVPMQTARPAPKLDSSIVPPRPDARRLSIAPQGKSAFYTANGSDGSRLWICGGTALPNSPCQEVWRANEWVAEVKTGRAELIKYKAIDGTPLTAWLLLPPDHSPDKKLPVITRVYLGSMYTDREPENFSLLHPEFIHPQLFASLGYAVLLPSMPEPKDPADWHSVARLTNGVLPAIDAVIERGFADPNRIAVMGQSDGGFATLGLITQTTRFRSAIASASFSDLASLYGTFYGQNRYGDSGPPQKGVLFRMLQMEKGSFGLGGPPWEKPERYRASSPILNVDKVQTPLMLVHGDSDFIPIQQAEQFYTALYRQDKRATFVRYHGEWHTIAARENVLDLWKRMTEWLAETLAPVN